MDLAHSQNLILWVRRGCEIPFSGEVAFEGSNWSLFSCVSSRSHGLHGAWQRAGRGGYGEKNGPAKPCEGRSDPQTGRLEEETPTATSFPQGAHAVLEQGELLRQYSGFELMMGKTPLEAAGDAFCLIKARVQWRHPAED
ncbi:hypothetical protein L3Q82_020437, partial [Scortum barcoo]